MKSTTNALALTLLACLLASCAGYTLQSSVSWAVSSKDAVEDADLSEEVAPALLADGGGLWKQAFPAGAEETAGERMKPEAESRAAQGSARLFSYRTEKATVAGGTGGPHPPPHQKIARTARYVAHSSDWGSLATISRQDKIKGIPFGNIFSVSDGPMDNSTGVIYFYMTPMDNTVFDLKLNPNASITFSEAEGDFCRKMVYDPEDPRCARLTLTGTMVEVAPEEQAFAKEAMFSRHPVMAQWPAGHNWFFMKLELIQVWLQDWTGGASLIPLEEYFKATPF